MIINRKNKSLKYPCNINVAERSNIYTAIKGFEISTKGELTCPVTVLMLFISETYIDIDSHQFTVYNYLKTFNSVVKFVDACEDMSSIYSYTLVNKSEQCEFYPKISKGLKPITWVKLHSNYCKVELSHVFTGKYLYAKLISSDDKRKYYPNNITGPLNIDCNYIIASGYALRL